MRHPASQAMVFYFVMAAIVAASLIGQEPSMRPAPTPEGDSDAISEWGLSGVVWGEANFVHKLAVETAKDDSSLTPEQKTELEKVADESKELIEAMERFGWQRLRRAPSDSSSAKAESSLSESELPDPKEVGAQLAESMGVEPSAPRRTPPSRQSSARAQNSARAQSSANAQQPGEIVTLAREERTGNAGIGENNPGIPEEAATERRRIDVSRYRADRYDNYIDKTPGSPRSVAQARADGVKGAIAAANPDVIAGLKRGRISQREAQTRSDTLPYSQGSVYDADDFDPDGDYIIGNALSDPEPGLEEAGIETPGVGDPLSRGPARNEPARRESVSRVPSSSETAKSKPSPKEVRTAKHAQRASERYQVNPKARPADADWVQLHLGLNEARWTAARKAGLNYQSVLTAEENLQTTVQSVRQVSDSSRLRSLLESN